MKKNLLSTSEVARILGITRVAVFKKIKSGDINAVKVGRNFVIDRNDLPGILSKTLSEERKSEIEKAVRKTIRDYGETLKLLGRE